MADLTARGALPSTAIKSAYQHALTSTDPDKPGVVEEMRNSVLWWIRARYRARQAEFVAKDASPARELEAELQGLFRQWDKRFDEFARIKSRWFARRVNSSATRQLLSALKESGLSVEFRNSRNVNNQLQSIIVANTGLIESIPQKFIGQVRTIVMQGVQNGRDMAYIAQEIEERYGKTRNEAIRLAVDQTNKATEAISRARCKDIGVTHGFWMHRSGSKTPRESHVKMNGKRFDLSKGLYDYAVKEYIKPGQLIWCRCSFRLDLSTIGGSMAMDARTDRFGRRQVVMPAATITWGTAA